MTYKETDNQIKTTLARSIGTSFGYIHRSLALFSDYDEREREREREREGGREGEDKVLTIYLVFLTASQFQSLVVHHEQVRLSGRQDRRRQLQWCPWELWPLEDSLPQPSKTTSRKCIQVTMKHHSANARRMPRDVSTCGECHPFIPRVVLNNANRKPRSLYSQVRHQLQVILISFARLIITAS